MKLSDFSIYREQVFLQQGKTENDVRMDVLILREWMKKQKHLPSDMMEDEFLEIQLLNNKFSIEKVKQKLEKYCTMKSLPHYKQYFEHIPTPSKEAVFYTPLPKLTNSFKRILLGRLFTNKNDYDLVKDVSGALPLREFLTRFDYNDGEILIFDHREITALHFLSSYRANVFADILELALGGFSARPYQIHIINKMTATVFHLIKPILPSKLLSKIYFHDDYTSLTKMVPPECLPKDYGGELESLEEILVKWDTIFEENKDLLRKYMDTKSNEELRLNGPTFIEMQGTFKQLNID
ncbi:hypothetical protein HHI36_011361 [Cryptolaemus montrouzieri]|uniref:CRAL-TRIO domain-containing protein n=1 Tax=Cryptolaemus montrouzieri TaxID=559131 RepID=A0ABD2MLG7_9CUCU